MKKKYHGAILVALLLGVGTLPAPLSAVTTDDETSAFNNPAQAQRAANLAEEAAISNDSVKEALQELEEAQAALGVKDTTAAREALAKAEEAYAKELADITGVVEKDIASMRDSGMGWGQIAHELGVHPSVNGLGHTKGAKNLTAEPTISGVNKHELAEATAKNLQSGWSKGHGVGVRSGVHESGTGLLDGVTKAGLARGHDKDRGSSGFSGAGGLGRGGGPDGSMDGSGVDGGHGNSGGNKGSSSSTSGGPGNSGSQGKAGKDGSPGKSGGQGNSGDRGKSGSDHGKSGDSHGNSGGKTS